VHINFCIIDILINSCNSYITSHNHVFPRRFICTHRRQPDPSHQATSRTRSRRRKRKTARRGKSPISAFLSLSPVSHIHANHLRDRNSTNTASSAASPNPVLRCPRANPPATLSAWKSTCLHGTSCPSNTSTAYREKLVLEAS
jgi:hypothetical protein